MSWDQYDEYTETGEYLHQFATNDVVVYRLPDPAPPWATPELNGEKGIIVRREPDYHGEAVYAVKFAVKFGNRICKIFGEHLELKQCEQS